MIPRFGGRHRDRGQCRQALAFFFCELIASTLNNTTAAQMQAKQMMRGKVSSSP